MVSSSTSSFPVPTVPVLQGGLEDRETVVKMVTAEGARAVLLFGEIGAGRTTLVERGVIPLLEEGGAMVLSPRPGAGLIDGFVAAAGVKVAPDEAPREALVRAIVARPGTPAVFVLDDVDLLLGGDEDGAVTDELHKLFMRVTTMTRGQARFLFTCADVRLHALDALERRAGTLFPANVRLRLPRLGAAAASAALAQACHERGAAIDEELGQRLVALADNGAGVLPAELPILARAAADLGLRSARDLVRLEAGRPDLVWIERAAERSGDRRGALRLLGALASARAPLAADALAAASDVEVGRTRAALAMLVAAGVCREAGERFALAHEILARRIRDLAAPVEREHDEARAALTAAVDRGQLSIATWRRLGREGIVPSGPGERRLVTRTRALARAAFAVACALPIALIIAYVVLQRGSFHFNGAGERLVVRSGRAFLPGGEVVADSGLTRDMLTAQAWRELGDAGGDYAARALGGLRPGLAALRRYALTADETALAALRAEVHGPDGWWSLLAKLEPIARGNPAEGALLREALGDPLTAAAAFGLVARTSTRRTGAYGDLLAEALLGDDGATRRQAAAIVAGLPGAGRAEVLVAAARAGKRAASRAGELLDMLEHDGELPAAAAAAAAASLLRGDGLPAGAAERAWRLLDVLLARDGKGTAAALAGLAADAAAPAGARERAARLLLERLPDGAPITKEVGAAAAGGVAGALPLLARLAPAEAATLLAGQRDPSVELRVAMAQAYGVLAAGGEPTAAEALDRLLDHGQPAVVRAAAARASGRLGQVGQDRLSLMALSEGPPVGEAALFGLAESVLVGAGTGRPMDAIFKLWQRKGVAKRRAAAAAVLLASVKPHLVADYLAGAIYDRTDAALHPIGADGLCRAADAGSAKAFNTLVTAAQLTDGETRARIGACLTGRAELATRLAPRLVGNADPALRAAVATALAGVPGQNASLLLVRLAGDGDRAVRQAAVAALSALGEKSKLPLAGAWAAAAADDKLAVLAAAETVGDTALVGTALADTRPDVRRRALRAGLALGMDIGAALESALADPDAAVRREALELLDGAAAKLAPARLSRALEIASRDPDPDVAELAARRLGALADPRTVEQAVASLLTERSEAARARAVHLAYGLAAANPDPVIRSLTPLLDDPAHDLRALALAALARAHAHKPVAELATMLRAERDANQRLVAAAALLERAPADRAAVQAALTDIRSTAAPFARATAELALALLDSGANGSAFLGQLLP